MRRPSFPFNPFDLTSLAEGAFPLIESVSSSSIAIRELLRRGGQAASPANITGIGFSPDRAAGGFLYGDTSLSFVLNFNHNPVNAPKCPFEQLSPRWAMRTDGTSAERQPTSLIPGRVTDQRAQRASLAIDGARPLGPSRDDDHYHSRVTSSGR